VLIAGGVLNLAYGTLLGYPITVIRVKGHPGLARPYRATQDLEALRIRPG
jgi:hypothetical protein